MNTTSKTIAIGILFSVFFLSLYPLEAQQQNRINPRVEVQRDYEGRIIEIEKPKLFATIPDSISQFNITMDYTIFDKPYHDLYSFAPLPSVRLSSPQTLKQPWAHIRLGALHPTTPLADILIQAPLTGMSALLLTAQHRSFWGELPRYAMAGTTIADQMQNRADVRYALNWEKGRFEIGGGYDYNYYTYYGVAPDLPESFNPINLYSRAFMRDNMAHAYSLYKADLSLSSLRSAHAGVEWNFAAGWSRLEDKARLWNVAGTSSRTENLVRFSGEVGKRFDSEKKFGVALYGSFSNNLASSELDRGVIAINPYYQVRKERFALHLGLTLLDALNYEANKTNNFFLYPDLKISYELIPANLMIYGDFRGENRHNSYQSLLAENPWLSHQHIQLHNSNQQWDIQVGFKGKIARRFGFNLYGQHVKTNNQHYFYSTFYMANMHQDAPYFVFLNNVFSLLYANEERLSAVAELAWNSTPLALRLMGKYHSYTLDSGVPAWYKPNTEFNFSARYQWRERIVATASVDYKGEVYASDTQFLFFCGTTSSFLSSPFLSSAFGTKIDPFIDVGLQLEYRFAEWFGLYVEGKNLLNAKKQYYLYYHEPGIRIGGGMTFRF